MSDPNVNSTALAITALAFASFDVSFVLYGLITLLTWKIYGPIDLVKNAGVAFMHVAFLAFYFACWIVSFAIMCVVMTQISYPSSQTGYVYAMTTAALAMDCASFVGLLADGGLYAKSRLCGEGDVGEKPY